MLKYYILFILDIFKKIFITINKLFSSHDLTSTNRFYNHYTFVHSYAKQSMNQRLNKVLN